VQERRFAEQIELARRVGKPVVCHVRDAHSEARAILAEAGRGVPAIIHCFTGTPEDATAYAELGLYVSFSGIVTFRGKKSDPIRHAVNKVPRERLLIETDCPYLAPEPHRGQRNEPSYLVHTAEVVARYAGLTLPELAAAARQNARRLFGLAPA
jgi:TatD DNase family protein